MKNPFKLLLIAIMAIFALTAVSCSEDDEPEVEPITKPYAGTFKGTISLNVASQYTYSAEISCTITAGDNETLTVAFPEYSLSGTMMGDMKLGAVTIPGLVYDETKGGFYRSYGGEGLTQTMNGTEYPLNETSTILVKTDGTGGIVIDNPFQLGKMPLPLTSTFTGKR